MSPTSALPRRVLVVLVVLTTVLGAACSSGSNDAKKPSGASGSGSTLPAAEAAEAYTKPGPYPVGVTTLTLEGGQKVEVWYPAVAGTTGTDTYNVRTLIPDTVRNLLTANIPATFTIDAGLSTTSPAAIWLITSSGSSRTGTLSPPGLEASRLLPFTELAPLPQLEADGRAPQIERLAEIGRAHV